MEYCYIYILNCLIKELINKTFNIKCVCLWGKLYYAILDIKRNIKMDKYKMN
jgi:hypothetical protein